MNSEHQQRETDQHSACENSAADPADSPPPCTGVRAEDMDTRTLGDHAFRIVRYVLSHNAPWENVPARLFLGPVAMVVADWNSRFYPGNTRNLVGKFSDLNFWRVDALS